MKTFLATFLILGFGSIAVFGFFGMNDGSGHEGCLAALASGMNCSELNPFLFISFHLSAFKSFSTAVLVVFAALSLIFMLDFFAVNLAPFFAWRRLVLARNFIAVPGEKFIHWLSLCENSPNFLLRR